MKKLFLIDDDEDDQFFFKEAVKSINPTLDCETAMNGKIALDKFKVSTALPDLIFVDLNMPVMNGYDFLIEIKKENELKKIPVGILSTSNNIRDKELTKNLGAIFFFTKPNDLKVLQKNYTKFC